MAPKAYLIHDNGGRPFRVVIKPTAVEVYKRDKKSKGAEESDEAEAFSVLIDTFPAKKVFVGKSSGMCEMCDHPAKQAKQFEGNSILVQTAANKYVYIGHEIFSFELKDEVDKYYSPVGHSDVPYPLILGKENVYFLLDKQYVPRDMFPKSQVWEDAYRPWYGTFTAKTGWESDYKPHAKKLKTKLIQKRVEF
jgi:hypothetical protein